MALYIILTRFFSYLSMRVQVHLNRTGAPSSIIMISELYLNCPFLEINANLTTKIKYAIKY